MNRNEDRDREILEKRKQGTTLREIANEYGLTHQRVDQICKRKSRGERFAVKREMKNSHVLRAYIIRAGDNMRDAADKIGLSYQSFMKRMYGMTDFRVGEIARLKEIYHISDEDFTLIFLTRE